MLPSRFRTAAACLLLAAAVLAVYSNHFQNTFHFDDEHAVVANPAISRLSNIPRFFTDATLFSITPEVRTWRPMVSTWLAIDYWLGGGLKPFYFHLTTFLWFEVLAVVLFFLFRRIMDDAAPHPANFWTALFAAALYALHPASAETVNYIVQRGDLYVTLGIAASLLVFTAFPEKRKYGLYLLPALAAFLSKATALVYPLILLAYVACFVKPDGKARWRSTLPAFLVTLVFAVLTVKMTPASFNAGADSPALYRLTQPWVALHYFKCFFLPTDLTADSDWTAFTDPFRPEALAGYAFVIALLAGVVFIWRQREMRPVAFGLFWFLIALLPTSLMPLADVTNDHRMFFPFVGLALAVVWALRLTIRPTWVRAVAVASAAVLIACAAGTRERNKVWRTEASLWHDVTVKSPKNGRGLMNYALDLLGSHQYAEALPYLQRAKVYKPDASRVEVALANAYAGLGRDAEAEQHYRKAMELEPEAEADNPAVHYSNWLRGKGRYAEADALLALAMQQIAPDAPATPEEALNRSAEYCRAGNYDGCLLMARRALKLRPAWAPAYSNLAAAYLAQQRWDEGIEAARQALAIDPNDNSAKQNLQWALAHRPQK